MFRKMINKPLSAKQGVVYLRWAAFGVFLGRAWQFLIWDAPFRTLFWDESFMGPLVRLFGSDWSDYLERVASDQNIGKLIVACGLVFLVCAIAVWILPRFSKGLIPLTIVGVGLLLFLTFLYWKEHFFIVAQLMEHTLQWSAPLFLLYYLKNEKSSKTVLLLLKLAVALTFVGHGLFALGAYPVPGHFTVMVVKILGLSQPQALQFLFWAGVLDMIIGVGVFLPFKWSKWIIAYAVFWGVATTSARIWSHFHIDHLEFVFWRWAPETLFRFPHFLMPLVLFMELRSKQFPHV